MPYYYVILIVIVIRMTVCHRICRAIFQMKAVLVPLERHLVVTTHHPGVYLYKA